MIAAPQDGLPLPRRRIAYVAIALSVTMTVLDTQIANTALPTIARELRASPTASVWVVNAFQLAVTSSLLAFASLGERRGPSKVYRWGVIGFIAGSLLCALAHSLPLLIAARALQGFGAAAVMAISPALLRDIFPSRQLGRALGLNAVVVATSAAAGPTAGGLILAVAPWPWLFAINVPIGIVNIFLNRALPDDGPGRDGMDWPSVVTSALAFTLTIWGIDGFARHEPAWTIALRLASGIGCGIAFSRRQFRLPEPMIALDLFRVPAFSMASATSFATFSAQGVAFVTLPFFFQSSLGRTPLESGLLLTSWPLTIAVVAPLAGRLSDRFPVGILATAGLAVFGAGLALYALLPANPGSPLILGCGIVCGAGFGFFQSPNNRELIGSAPREKSPSAGGILAALRVGGQTLGTALVAIVFGAFGAASAVGHPSARGAVTHAVPTLLWLACACAVIATVASALRLRHREGGPSGAGTSGSMKTTVDELRSLGPNGATVISVGQHEGKSEIRGAIRYRPHDLLTPDHLALPIAAEKPVVLYDERGESDLTDRIAERLRGSGYADVRVLQGGFAAWQDAGGETQEASIEQVVPPTATSQVQQLDRRV